VPYFETSAKLYQKVDKIFLTVVKKVQTSITVADQDIGQSGGGGGSGKAGGVGKKSGAIDQGGGGGSGDIERGEYEEDPSALGGGEEDIVEGNCCYDNFCCRCCPKPFRKCGKRCGKKCTIM